MNLIISGDNPQHLAEVEALARALGLLVNRELETNAARPGPGKLRFPVNKGSLRLFSGRHLEEFPHKDKGPLYGIE